MSDPCQPFSARFLATSTARSQAGRAVLVSCLAALLTLQPALAEAAPGRVELQSGQRVLQTLNRFTFGPRPGDVAAVQKLGVDRWFERQLDPDAIDDSAFEAQLAAYPAMQLSVADLVRKYPSPGVVRGMATGRIALPQDATARTLAEDQIALYNNRIAGKGAVQKAGGGDSVAALSGTDDAEPESFPQSRLEQILALAPGQRLSAILAMPPQRLVALRRALRGSPGHRLVAGMSPDQRETLLALGGSNRMIAAEEMDTRLLRDVASQRQLQAVMTDFWLNHFNVYVRKNQNEPGLIPSYERTIRAHSLGNFEDLLVATAQSPAMLQYLDNFRSIGPDSAAARRVELVRARNPEGPVAKNASAGLNENYARELMELHTLGVDGGYTQADVTQVAKVFTGWTIERPAEGGDFQFDERRHEPGSKMVLGRKIRENGEKEGLEVLHMLANSPATAHFISQQLAVRFVSDDPPPALVDRMAATFVSSHGDIKSVLRTLFHSPEFWSPAVYRAKIKTPEEFVVSAVRASDVQINDPAALVQSLQRLGMPLYGMQTPNGYSWKKDGWVSTGALVSRMNFALVLSGDRLPGTRTDWQQVLGEDPARHSSPQLQAASYGAAQSAETVDRKELLLERALLNEPVSARTRATVVAQANDGSVSRQAEQQFNLKGDEPTAPAIAESNLVHPPQDHAAAVMAGLLLGSPEFQRR